MAAAAAVGAGSKRKVDETTAAEETTLTAKRQKTTSVATTLYTKAYLSKCATAGTLANGGVYVAVSDLAEQPMLGLFTGRAFKKGEVVTLYGGVVADADDMRRATPAKFHTHVIRIPGSDTVRDGLLWSQQFDIGLPVDVHDPTIGRWSRTRGCPVRVAEFAMDMKRPPRERTRVLPTGNAEAAPDSDEKLFAQILTDGIGYMANTATLPGKPRGHNNVRIHALTPRKDGLGLRVPAFIASHDIPAHTEICVAYNWKTSKFSETVPLAS
jgi:hypothetical protein